MDDEDFDDPLAECMEGAKTQPPEQGSAEWAHQILDGLRRFDPDNPPPEVAPVITLRDIPVATVGNLVLLSGQSGCAKSHSLAAIMASALAPDGTAPDCLGWSMPNPERKAVIYLDFEQSEQDFDSLLRGAMRRAGVDTLPTWFTALHLTGTEPNQGCDILHAALVDARARMGGTLAVFTDGIADLCNSPNEEAEAFGLVREIHAWARDFKTLAFSVLHLNPGSDSVKMRGHLGSQAERKAETVLTAKRNGDLFTVYATKTRHRPIPEAHGARFKWDEDAAMFLTVASAAEVREDRKAEEHSQLARDAFAGQPPSIQYKDLCARIMELAAVKIDAAKKKVSTLRAAGFVEVQAGTGLYKLGRAAQ